MGQPDFSVFLFKTPRGGALFSESISSLTHPKFKKVLYRLGLNPEQLAMFFSQELREFPPRGVAISHQSMPSGGEKYARVIQMLSNKDKGVLQRIEVANMSLAPKIAEEGFQAERIHRRLKGLKGFDALQVTSGSATLGIYNDLETGAGYREVKLEPGSVVVMPVSVIRSWVERDYIQFRWVSSPPWNQTEVRRVSLAA